MKKRYITYRMEKLAPTIIQFYYSDSGSNKSITVELKNEKLIFDSKCDSTLQKSVTNFFKLNNQQ